MAPNGRESYASNMFPLFLMVVWFVVSVLAPLLDKKAKGQPGGVPVSYFLMMTPLMWGVYWALNYIHSRLGYCVVGGLNLVLLAGALISCAKDLRKIFQKA